MHSVLTVILSAVFSATLALAQTAEPPKQKAPTKDDPQGYSKDVLDSKDKDDDSILGHPPAYKPREDKEIKPVEIPPDLNAVIKKQFGPNFHLSLTRTTSTVEYLHPVAEEWTPFLTADLDGDGVMDAIIVARCAKPIKGEVDFHYKVIDPYFTFHGYGEPKITAAMGSENPDEGHIVLIIHGAGPDAWRAAVPKAKYAVVNLPFENLTIAKMERKKKATLDTLSLDVKEMNGSTLYWDGKKYKWKEEAVGAQ